MLYILDGVPHTSQACLRGSRVQATEQPSQWSNRHQLLVHSTVIDDADIDWCSLHAPMGGVG